MKMRKPAWILLAAVFVVAVSLGFFTPAGTVEGLPAAASACPNPACESACQDDYEECIGRCLQLYDPEDPEYILCRYDCFQEKELCLSICE